MPAIYWAIAFNFIQVKLQDDWNSFWKPHAEMIGQLTHPEIYKEYKKYKDSAERKELGEPGSHEYNVTKDGVSGGGVASAHYDPEKGLVDTKGKVLVAKDDYDKLLGLDGAMMSY